MTSVLSRSASRAALVLVAVLWGLSALPWQIMAALVVVMRLHQAEAAHDKTEPLQLIVMACIEAAGLSVLALVAHALRTSFD